MRFRAQIDEQVSDRFPNAKDVLLVGDAVSHYWKPDSDVDVLLLVDQDDVPDARAQLDRVNGHPLANTNNNVYFWVFGSNVSPNVIAKHFGPIYSLGTSVWYGKHVQDEMELRRAAGLLQRANWKLFRAKYMDDPFPYTWKVLKVGFSTLSAAERTDMLDAIRYRVAQIDRNVTELLRTQPKEIWRAAEDFDQYLQATEEVPLDADQLPRKVVLAILHRFRYEDLLATLESVDDRLTRHEQYQNRTAAPRNRKEDGVSVKILRDRLLQISDMLLQQQGGSARAIESMYAQIQHLLENSRYVLTDMRRRRIAYLIYRRYYLGKQEK